MLKLADTGRRDHHFALLAFAGPLDEPFRKHVDDPVKGKVVVRANDGIHFTPAGLRLISDGLTELLRMRWQ